MYAALILTNLSRGPKRTLELRSYCESCRNEAALQPSGPNERYSMIITIVFKTLLVAAAAAVALSPVLVGVAYDHFHVGRRRTPHYSASPTAPTVEETERELVGV